MGMKKNIESRLDWDKIFAEPTIDKMGRHCIAEVLGKRYDLDPDEIWEIIKDMTSLERDEYIDLLKSPKIVPL